MNRAHRPVAITLKVEVPPVCLRALGRAGRWATREELRAYLEQELERAVADLIDDYYQAIAAAPAVGAGTAAAEADR